MKWEPEFQPHEFKHPELINEMAYRNLVFLRRQFGKPLIVTDDARLATDKPTGYSPTSLHYKGQAFDLRIRDFTPEDLWRFVAAVQSVGSGIELELVWGKTDKHAHVGFWLDHRPSVILLEIE